MSTIDNLLEQIFAGQERVSRDEMHRRAVAASLGADELVALDALPEGEYSQEEAADALGRRSGDGVPSSEAGASVADGIPAGSLSEDDLVRELASLHRTRHETFLHGSSQALQRHSERTAELELEFVRRHPEREIDGDRLRSGARQER